MPSTELNSFDKNLPHQISVRRYALSRRIPAPQPARRIDPVTNTGIYTASRPTYALLPGYYGSGIRLPKENVPHEWRDDTSTKNNVRKAICNAKCTQDHCYLSNHPNTDTAMDKTGILERTINTSKCKLGCYQDMGVLLSGNKLCDTRCGAMFGATDSNDPQGKAICAPMICGLDVAEDYRIMYSVPDAEALSEIPK